MPTQNIKIRAFTIFSSVEFKTSIMNKELFVETSLILTDRESGHFLYCYIIGLELIKKMISKV
jgi:hypothetical protein